MSLPQESFERRRIEQRVLTQNSVIRALAQSATLAEAAAKMLQAVCTHLGWDVGLLWYVDADGKLLRLSEAQALPGVQAEGFIAASRERSFAPGVGLPGRVWQDAAPAWIAELSRDANFPRAPAAAREGLRAAFAFPVMLESEVLGVMEFFSRAPQPPDGEVLEMMSAIGRQVGQFVDRRRSEERLQESERRLSTLVANLPGMAYRCRNDAHWSMEFVSDGVTAITGHAPAEFVSGAVYWESLQHPEDVSWTHQAIEEAAASRAPFRFEYRIRHRDGSERWVWEQGQWVYGADGAPLAFEGFVTDTTERKRAENATRVLAAAGRELSASLDYERTLASVARVVVPTFADWCAVDLLDAGGKLRRLAVAHYDPARMALAQELHDRYPPNPNAPYGGPHVVRTGKPERMAEIPEAIIEAVAQDAEHLRILRELKLRSYLCVPLDVQGERFGAITFVSAESGRSYDEHDLAVALEIARRASQAIENARLYRELGKSEELVRTIAENSTQAMVMMDARGYVTYCNRAWLEMTGYSAEEIRSKPLHYLVHHHHPDGRPYPMEECPIDRALPENFDVRAHEDLFFRKDGSTFPVLCAASPVFKDGRPVSTVIEVRDMTQVRRAETALRESEARFQIAARATNDAIWDWNLATHEVWWNEGVHTLFGYRGGDVGPHAKWWYEQIHPEDRDRVVHSIHEVIDGGGTFWRGEYRYRRADGSYAEVFDRGYVMRDAAGKAVRMIGAMQDVTERKRAEEALREADRRKDEFLATLAHELRNPLAPLQNGLALLQQAPPQALEPTRVMMERQVGLLVRLIDDLLDVSRITRGKVELRRSRVELAPLLEQALETAASAEERAQRDIRFELPAAPVTLDADPVRLVQVFNNLLSNACKFTPPGKRITVRAEQAGGELVVAVRDEGMGIPAEKLGTIFDMFAQLDSSPGRMQGGLGIGLTLARRLAEMHGGSLTASSEGPGRGAEFVVRLPLAAAPAASSPATQREPRKEPDVTYAPRRILVVDDNRDAAESLAMLLRFDGNETELAFSGPEALAKVESFKPEVVLLDIGMPGMSGYETCRALRERPGGEAVSIIALTGWGQDADRQRSEEAGFNAHLVKPVDQAALAKVLGAAP